jgi:hypothetical protein
MWHQVINRKKIVAAYFKKLSNLNLKMHLSQSYARYTGGNWNISDATRKKIMGTNDIQKTYCKMLTIQGVLKRALQFPNVTAWRVLRKSLHLKAYKLSIVQGVEYLEYHCEALFETPCIINGSHIEMTVWSKTWRIFLHYDNLKHFIRPLNKFV